MLCRHASSGMPTVCAAPQAAFCLPRTNCSSARTLRSLLWTLLSSKGHPLLGGEPIAKRVIICCPTSLVG